MDQILNIPSALWLSGLQAATPTGDGAALMAWQRSLAFLACTSRAFRDLLRRSEAAQLYSHAAIVRHFDWRTWRMVGRGACTTVARELLPNRRRHLVTELHLDCSSIDAELLLMLLMLLHGSLRRLHVTCLSRSAAQQLFTALPIMLRLDYLSLTGPHLVPGLPHLCSITCLDILLHGPDGLTSGDLSRCLENQWQLQELTIRIAGFDQVLNSLQPDGVSSMATMLFGLLRISVNPFPSLTALAITQQFRVADWRKLAGPAGDDPLEFLVRVVSEVYGQVLSMMRGEWEQDDGQPRFACLETFEVDLQLPGDCCSTVSGLSAETLLGDDWELSDDEVLLLESGSQTASDSDMQRFQAPRVWRQTARWRLWRAADGTRDCDFDEEYLFD